MRSFIADPSAKNSGFDKTSNDLLCGSSKEDLLLGLRIDFIASAVLTGSVLFSTIIVCPLE